MNSKERVRAALEVRIPDRSDNVMARIDEGHNLYPPICKMQERWIEIYDCLALPAS
jgi:hypothetical protein